MRRAQARGTQDIVRRRKYVPKSQRSHGGSQQLHQNQGRRSGAVHLLEHPEHDRNRGVEIAPGDRQGYGQCPRIDQARGKSDGDNRPWHQDAGNAWRDNQRACAYKDQRKRPDCFS